MIHHTFEGRADSQMLSKIMPPNNREQLYYFYHIHKAHCSACEITSLTTWKDTAPLAEESKVELI